MKNFVVISIILFVSTSCEKEIDVDLNAADPQVVIDGAITNAAGPYFVRLSETVNFSDNNSFPPITGATVRISDDLGTVDNLQEVSPGLYQTNITEGVPGRTYYLDVQIGDQHYQATSTMPPVVDLDSIRFTPFSNPLDDDTYATVPVFTDPATRGNNYRFILTVNNEVDGAYIVFNDNVNNGLVNERPVFSSDLEITLGDVVTVEMRCLDYASYLYFYALSQISGDGPGGGTTPANPPNNITGDEALGIFSAYTVQRVTKEVERE
jgi:hypothetical protein